MVIDTNVRRRTGNFRFNERRSQCEEATSILRDLIVQLTDNTQAREIKALRDISQTQFERYKQYLPENLRRRAGYVIAEDERFPGCRIAGSWETRSGRPDSLARSAGLRDEYEVSVLSWISWLRSPGRFPAYLGRV